MLLFLKCVSHGSILNSLSPDELTITVFFTVSNPLYVLFKVELSISMSSKATLNTQPTAMLLAFFTNICFKNEYPVYSQDYIFNMSVLFILVIPPTPALTVPLVGKSLGTTNYPSLYSGSLGSSTFDME